MLKATESALQAASKAWEYASVNGVPRDDVLVKVDAGVLRKLAEAYALETMTALPLVVTAPPPIKVPAPPTARPEPFYGSVASHRTGTLQGTTKAKISKILGFKPNSEGDASKVTAEWIFTYKGEKFAIWDYKGSARQGQFSTFGPKALLSELFGPDYCSEY